MGLVKAKIYYTSFPVAAPYGRESCQLVADLFARRVVGAQTSPQQVGNKSLQWNLGNESKRQEITDFCRRQLFTDLLRIVVYVADLLWTCYKETGVMDFGFYAQNSLHTFPRNFPVDGVVANLSL